MGTHDPVSPLARLATLSGEARLEIHVEVHTATEGPLASLGHAPVLAVGKAAARVSPGPKISVEIDASSLNVVSGETPKDARQIEEKVREKLLDAGHYPRIRFESSELQAGERDLLVRGNLTIAGHSHEITLPFHVESDGSLVGQKTLRQTDYGLTPLSAFFGAMRARDEVVVKYRVVIPE